MITYALYCEIRHLQEQGLSARAIARQLHLGRRTVRRWLAREAFTPRATPRRPSKLDPWRSQINRLVALHPYRAQQLFQQLRDQEGIREVTACSNAGCAKCVPGRNRPF